MSVCKRKMSGGVLEIEVVIPDGVTDIPSYAFQSCRPLTSVIIPDSVKSIGNGAFFGCSSLASVTMGNSIQIIGKEAFSNCPIERASMPTVAISRIAKSKLKEVVITSGQIIGEEAFFGCNKLTSVIIPNSVVSIGSSAFSGCNKLTSITIPDSVVSIGSSAFSGCSKLTSVTISDSVTSIDSFTFKSCSKLKRIVIPKSVTSIGDWTFSGCSKLTSIVIPSSVTSIGDWSFYRCSSLTKVNYLGTIDDWVQIEFKSRDSNPLGYAKNLYINDELVTEVTIGDSVISIDKYALYGCSSLTSINVDENNTYYKSIDGNLFSKDGKTLLQYAIGKTANAFIISDSVTSIGECAFSNCHSLTSVIISAAQLVLVRRKRLLLLQRFNYSLLCFLV